MRRSCYGCKYCRHAGGTNMYICHYMLDTGELRGCSPESCTRYTTKQGYKRRSKYGKSAERKMD